jgi:L-arabonate dehydrase
MLSFYASMSGPSASSRMTNFKPAEWPRELRSTVWFKGDKKHNIFNRAWLRDQPDDVLDGRPVIGVFNTWSELTV